MTTIVISFLIAIFAIVMAVKTSQKASKNKRDCVKGDTTIKGSTTVTSPPDESAECSNISKIEVDLSAVLRDVMSNSQNIDYSENRRKREEKKDRMTKLDLVLGAHVFICAFKDYLSISNFYDLEQKLPVFEKELAEYLTLYKRPDFEKIRVKAIKEFKDTHPNETITKDERFLLSNPQQIIIDKHDLSKRASIEFGGYWNRVLNGYKQKAAYKKRLKYLIDYIDSVIDKPMIADYPDVKQRMIDYKAEYNNQLTAASI